VTAGREQNTLSNRAIGIEGDGGEPIDTFAAAGNVLSITDNVWRSSSHRRANHTRTRHCGRRRKAQKFPPVHSGWINHHRAH
jgi:hypothetical protein